MHRKNWNMSMDNNKVQHYTVNMFTRTKAASTDVDPRTFSH